jgi:hypothetical protein
VDRLQAWFDGAEAISLAVGIGALIVSLYVAGRESRTAARTAELQEHVTWIEVERRREEVAHRSQADLRATIRRFPGESGRTQTYLIVMNIGGATAENVDVVDLADAKQPDTRPHHINSPYPVPRSHPGEDVSSTVAITINLSGLFEIEMTWDDARGPQRKVQNLTETPG